MTAGTDASMDEVRHVLATARALGFLGPGPVEPHLAHALAFSRVLESELVSAPLGPASVLDLGSGGGLPGLVLAVVRPGMTVALLDAQQRRTAFLEEAARRLGVTARVHVLAGRAESIGRTAEHRQRFDAVVARSFGRPGVTAECAAPFLHPGGVLVGSEPPPDPRVVRDVTGGTPAGEAAGRSPEADRGRWPAAGLALLGMDAACQVRDEFHFVVVRQAVPCPDRFPRRVGHPAKRPLF